MTEDQWKHFRKTEAMIRLTYFTVAASVAGILGACNTIYEQFRTPHAYAPYVIIVYSALLVWWPMVLADVAETRRQLRELLWNLILLDIQQTRYVQLREQRDSIQLTLATMTTSPSHTPHSFMGQIQ